MSTSEIEYNFIIKRLNEARLSGNKRSISIWKGKLEKWQLAYGAYAPVRI
jgi:hypothetical protein